ncbi:hypothetical protein CYCD_11930 [Tenuifilaceae bacterium CYCD]|nr:hypothetical protein CYCD_11930 [Tenuifilaceae bacterium CYCD]
MKTREEIQEIIEHVEKTMTTWENIPLDKNKASKLKTEIKFFIDKNEEDYKSLDPPSSIRLAFIDISDAVDELLIYSESKNIKKEDHYFFSARGRIKNARRDMIYGLKSLLKE